MSECRLIHGDCLAVLPSLEAGSVDAVVTDPPYGLEFMNKEWDSFRGDAWRSGSGFSKPGIGERKTPWPAFGSGDSANATCEACGGRMRGANKCRCEAPDWRVKGKPLGERNANAEQMRAYQEWSTAWASACLRVLKPGGVLLAFGGTRTFHRLACAIEDAGFRIQDTLCWLHGQGFPKHKAHLKPAWEPIILARKPGPLWLGVEECRLSGAPPSVPQPAFNSPTGKTYGMKTGEGRNGEMSHAAGRWPANVALSCDCPDDAHGPECPVRMLDEQSGVLTSGNTRRGPARRAPGLGYHNGARKETPILQHGDTGGASRFFATFPGEFSCTLCSVPYNRHGEKTQEEADSCKNSSAPDAERDFRTSLAIIASSVPAGAPPGTVERIARSARSAASLCDSCAIAFAVALAETLRLGSSNVASPAIRACTGNFRNSTRIQSLASCAANLGSIDTILTTQSLSKLFGSVLDAIDDFTSPASGARAVADSGPEAATRFRYVAKASKRDRGEGNTHPTVKPSRLCEWLVKLACPEGGTVLDPFVGSGTVALAALKQGKNAVGIERDAGYFAIAEKRIAEGRAKSPLFSDVG